MAVSGRVDSPWRRSAWPAAPKLLPPAPTPGLTFGHAEPPAGTSPQSRKKRGIWKLLLGTLLDVSLLGGSVFFADRLLPHSHDHHHDHRPQVTFPQSAPETNHPPILKDPSRPPQEPLSQEPSGEHSPNKNHTEHPSHGSSFQRALQISGVAAGIHMVFHLMLAGGWFVYGRYRGSQHQDEVNAQFEALGAYIQRLSREGGEFEIRREGKDGFRVVRRPLPETPPATPETKDPTSSE